MLMSCIARSLPPDADGVAIELDFPNPPARPFLAAADLSGA